MTCDHYKEQLTHWVTNQLTGLDRITLENHLSQCDECRQELAELLQTWEMTGRLPAEEPSDMLRVRFQAMLETYKATNQENRNSWTQMIGSLRPSGFFRPAFFLAYSLLLLA